MDELDQAFANDFVVNNTYSNQEIKHFLSDNRKLGAVYDNPTAYTYNRINKGMKSGWRPYFEYVGRNTYIYLGPKYKYTGQVEHHQRQQVVPAIVATWTNGIIQFKNGESFINGLKIR